MTRYLLAAAATAAAYYGPLMLAEWMGSYRWLWALVPSLVACQIAWSSYNRRSRLGRT